MKFTIKNAGFDPDIGDYVIDIGGPRGETSITFFGPDADELAEKFMRTLNDDDTGRIHGSPAKAYC